MQNAVANLYDGDTTCRICLEGQPMNDLISPCNCRGSTKFVHQSCLLEYATKNNKIEENSSTGRYELRCEICSFIMGVNGQKKYVVNNWDGILNNFRQNLGSLLTSIVILLLSLATVGYLVNTLGSKHFSTFNPYQYAIFGLIMLSTIICVILIFLVLKQLLIDEIIKFQIKDKKLQPEETATSLPFVRQVGNYTTSH